MAGRENTCNGLRQAFGVQHSPQVPEIFPSIEEEEDELTELRRV